MHYKEFLYLFIGCKMTIPSSAFWGFLRRSLYTLWRIVLSRLNTS